MGLQMQAEYSLSLAAVLEDKRWVIALHQAKDFH